MGEKKQGLWGEGKCLGEGEKPSAESPLHHSINFAIKPGKEEVVCLMCSEPLLSMY